MAKWTLIDNVAGGLGVYTFGVNPGDHDTEDYEKNFQFEAVVIPGTPPLLYEGQDNPTTIEIAGTLLTEDQHKTFVQWWNLRRQVLLTDDRGYQRWVYIYSYQATRKKSALYPWKMDWTMKMYLISPATFP